MDGIVDSARQAGGVELEQAHLQDDQLVERLSELRLIKDEHEIAQLRESVDMTVRGFEDVVRALPHAIAKPRGERLVEGAVSYTHLTLPTILLV